MEQHMSMGPHSAPTTEQVRMKLTTGQQLYRSTSRNNIYCFTLVELLKELKIVLGLSDQWNEADRHLCTQHNSVQKLKPTPPSPQRSKVILLTPSAKQFKQNCYLPFIKLFTHPLSGRTSVQLVLKYSNRTNLTGILHTPLVHTKLI